MISDKTKTGFEFGPHYVFKPEKGESAGYQKSAGNTSRPIKKERSSIPPLLTSYTVPFHFVDSGRRNQLLICEGHKYILNNKYGEKSCKFLNGVLVKGHYLIPFIFYKQISNVRHGILDVKHALSQCRPSQTVRMQFKDLFVVETNFSMTFTGLIRRNEHNHPKQSLKEEPESIE